MKDRCKIINTGKILGLIVSTLLFGSHLETFSFAQEYDAQEMTERMLGGHRADLSSTAVAYIQLPTASCSGVLVGPEEVLTAGHCANTPESAEAIIEVGGAEYLPISYWYSRYYNEADPSTSKYDLGMYILGRPVTNVSPIPVIQNEPFLIGQSLTLAGYGLTGIKNQYGPNYSRIGKVTVTGLKNDMLTTTFSLTKTIPCQGDSGGPIVMGDYGFSAVVGTVSNGNTRQKGELCVRTGEKDNYVDLQSSESVAFLSNFPNVEYLSVPLTAFYIGIKVVKAGVNAVLTYPTLAKTRAGIKILNSDITLLTPYADSNRLPYLAQVTSALATASSSTSLPKTRAALKTAKAQINILVSLGNT